MLAFRRRRVIWQTGTKLTEQRVASVLKADPEDGGSNASYPSLLLVFVV
jgi:hypothetical protein